MVKAVTSLGRSGLQDWIIQRITAVILALYVAFLLVYCIVNSNFNFDTWRMLFMFPLMKFATFMALLSLLAHAWIGIWTVITDYINPVLARLFIQLLIIIALLFYLVWGIQIIWGN